MYRIQIYKVLKYTPNFFTSITNCKNVIFEKALISNFANRVCEIFEHVRLQKMRSYHFFSRNLFQRIDIWLLNYVI